MRILTCVVVLLLPLAAHAQARRHGDISYMQPRGCGAITAGSNRYNPYASLFREHCEHGDARLKQTLARIRGRPLPSTNVLSVPAHGSPEAKRHGIACMGGLVMLRLGNGWQQALDADRRYYTCRV